MIIKISSEDELQKVAAVAIHLIINLRNATKNWEGEYGAELKLVKKNWEKKADEFIHQLQATEHRQDLLKIEIENATANTTKED